MICSRICDTSTEEIKVSQSSQTYEQKNRQDSLAFTLVLIETVYGLKREANGLFDLLVSAERPASVT